MKRPSKVRRPPGKLPPHRKITYAAETDGSWFVDAYCDEVECTRWRNGFKVVVDLSTGLGQRQDAYLSRDRSREALRRRTGPATVEYVYPPGTACFAQHQRRLDRPPIYVVRRGAPGRDLGERRVHRNADDWVEDMAEHQDRLAQGLR